MRVPSLAARLGRLFCTACVFSERRWAASALPLAEVGHEMSTVKVHKIPQCDLTTEAQQARAERVASLTRAGHSATDIAFIMGISVRTVER